MSTTIGANANTPFDFIASVRRFMEISGQYKGQGDLKTYGFYTGMQLEELAEKMEIIAAGEPNHSDRMHLTELVTLMKLFSTRFKGGMHLGAIGLADLPEMLDGDIDLAWVSVGAAHFATKGKFSTQTAFEHVAQRNLAKFPNGVVLRDANGKVMKPEGWTAPDHTPFVTSFRAD
jgi:predicted HAD superfamily Cof-like phosphohydrolase